MYVGVGMGMGKGRTYDATWVDVPGAECVSHFGVSVAQIMQAKKICNNGRASHLSFFLRLTGKCFVFFHPLILAL